MYINDFHTLKTTKNSKGSFYLKFFKDNSIYLHFIYCYYYFCSMSKRNKKQAFTNLEVIDAGAKGKTIAKAPDGKVVFISFEISPML